MKIYATPSRISLSKQVNTGNFPRQSPAAFFRDNRPAAATQRDTLQHISCSPRVNQQKALQQLADLHTTKVQLETNRVCQRVPESFRSLPYLEIESHARIFHRWESILTAVAEYSQLEESLHNKRRDKLQKIKLLIDQWRVHNATKTPPVTLVERKRAALVELETLLRFEWRELNRSQYQDTFYTGNLQPSPAGTSPVEPDPLLTRQAKDDHKWAFFNQGAKILEYLSNSNSYIFYTPDPTPGEMCEVKKAESFPMYHITSLNPAQGRTNDNLWVEPTYVTIVEKTLPQPDLSYLEPTFEDMLFTHDPCIEDVRQGNIGDCYLLASILSLVYTSPGEIRNMMKDNLDGTVTVRLFDITTSPLAYTPRNITVYKKLPIHTESKKNVFASGALWVSILEKAYIAAGFIGTSPLTIPMNTTPYSYGMIEAGQESYALQHLTGKNTTTYTTSKDSSLLRTFKNLLRNSSDLDELQTKYNKLTSNEAVRREEITALINSYKTKIDTEAHKIMPGSGLTAENIIKELAVLYPEKRGSGIYTAFQLNLFMQIRDALKSNRFVCTGSNSKVITKSYFNSREDLGKGLAGTHAYAILDYAPRTFADKLTASASNNPDAMPVLQGTSGTEDFIPTLLSLKLANPWGTTENPNAGRSYSGVDLNQEHHPTTRRRMRATGSSNSQFLIELSDFTKRFSRFTISNT